MTSRVKLTAGLVAVAGAVWCYAAAGRDAGRPIRVGTPVGGRVEKTEAEWRAALTPEAYRVTRGRGTERAFCGAYWNHHGDGEYRCVCCGQRLFDSAAGFDSGTGWPSFLRPVDDNAVSLYADGGLFGERTELRCSRCDAHLGHVFDDGPRPSGQRYCLNSAALSFAARATPPPAP